MLNLNYYFVDVDENSCLIAEMDLDLDIRGLLLARNKALLKFVKEYATRMFRQKAPFLEEDDFKVVFVNKEYKISVKAQVADSETHKSVGSPTVVTQNYEIFFINPGQELHVECQVVPRETEIRSIEYDRIKANCSKRYMKLK